MFIPIYVPSGSAQSLLHLIEHVRKCRFELERLLDLVPAHIRVFAIFKETRAMMLADKFDECRGIGLPVLGKTLEIFEYRIDARRREKCYRILGILVEVRVEDALI